MSAWHIIALHGVSHTPTLEVIDEISTSPVAISVSRILPVLWHLSTTACLWPLLAVDISFKNHPIVPGRREMTAKKKYLQQKSVPERAALIHQR